MAEDFQKGLLEQFGLTSLTKEELQAKRTQAIFAAGNEFAQKRIAESGLDPASKQAGAIGAMIGQAVRAKISGKAALSESETNKVEAVQAAQRRYNESLARNPNLHKVDNESKQNVMQQLLADELGQRGEVNLSLQIGAQLEEKRRNQRMQAIELEKAGITLEREKIGAELDDLSLTQAKRGKMVPIYPINSSNPNSSKMVFFDAEGKAHGPDGQPVDMNGFTTIRPVPGTDGKDVPLRDRMTPRQQAAMRAKQRAIHSKMRNANKMKDALAQAAAGSNGEINIMDGAGNITLGVSKAIDSFMAVGRQISQGLTTVLDENGKNVGDLGQSGRALRYARENRASLDKIMNVELLPANVRNDVVAREKYYSALVQMAYAQALAQEGGSARSLSDNDFKNAMAALAGSTSNPESFRQVMLSGVEGDLEEFELWKAQIGDELYSQVVTPAAQSMFRKDVERFREGFGQDFGTAANPGPGLVPSSSTNGITNGPNSGIIQRPNTKQVGGATITFID